MEPIPTPLRSDRSFLRSQSILGIVPSAKAVVLLPAFFPVFFHCLPVNSTSSEEISVKFSGVIDNRTRNRWLHLGDVVDYRLYSGIFRSILYHRLAKVFVL